jgi:hypothetical protein
LSAKLVVAASATDYLFFVPDAVYFIHNDRRDLGFIVVKHLSIPLQHLQLGWSVVAVDSNASSSGDM